MSIYDDIKLIILACSLTLTVIGFAMALLRGSDWGICITLMSVGVDWSVSASMAGI